MAHHLHYVVHHPSNLELSQKQECSSSNSKIFKYHDQILIRIINKLTIPQNSNLGRCKHHKKPYIYVQNINDMYYVSYLWFPFSYFHPSFQILPDLTPAWKVTFLHRTEAQSEIPQTPPVCSVPFLFRFSGLHYHCVVTLRKQLNWDLQILTKRRTDKCQPQNT